MKQVQTLYPASGTSGLTAVRTALVLLLLCGGIYPLIATMLGGWLFPSQSTGSLIIRDGNAVGSTLVGQPFASESFFYGRPSAAGYDPFAVSGSNLAPGNPDLRARITNDAQAIAKHEQIPISDIPVDLLAASGSGIDPHISPVAAELQIARVARARHLDPAIVRQWVEQHTEPPVFGVLGQPRVNVLTLNLALDGPDKNRSRIDNTHGND